MLLYHVSYDIDGDLKRVFTPRVPDNVRFDEEATIKRICFTDSIQNCIRAIDGYYKNDSDEIAVFIYEVEDDSPVIVPWLDLYDKGLVNDASLTHEYWYVGDMPLVLQGKKYKIQSYFSKEQMIIEAKFKDKMIEVLKQGGVYASTCDSLQSFELLEMINLDEELINIAKDVVCHLEPNENYYPDMEEILGWKSEEFVVKIDWDSMDVVFDLIAAPIE